MPLIHLLFVLINIVEALSAGIHHLYFFNLCSLCLFTFTSAEFVLVDTKKTPSVNLSEMAQERKVCNL